MVWYCSFNKHFNSVYCHNIREATAPLHFFDREDGHATKEDYDDAFVKIASQETGLLGHVPPDQKPEMPAPGASFLPQMDPTTEKGCGPMVPPNYSYVEVR
jgi:hypothetical protein